jgi:putative RNA 2'-phosphotransferase
MTHPALIERITRSLAYMLRHQPDQFDLELDDYGFAEIDEVVRALNERLGEPVDEENVERAVTSGDRVRYEFQDGRIRALYGHSISVLPGEPTKPPEVLHIGVSSRDGERAMRNGLRPGRRSFLHLALTEDDARESGRRLGREYTIITVHALDAWEEGINFYDRKSLYLSDPIPVQYLEAGEVYTDGDAELAPGRRDGRGARGRGGRGGRDDRAPRGDRDEGPRREGREGGSGREARGRGGRGRDDSSRSTQREGAGRGESPRRDDRARSDEHPRRDDRPRSDERPRRDDRPRSDERPRRDDRPRSDDRPRRDERPRREDSPRREERQPAAATRDDSYEMKPSAPPAPEPASEPFGLGVVEAPEPKRKPKPERKAPKRAEPKPPEPEERAPSSDTGGFGSGI